MDRQRCWAGSLGGVSDAGDDDGDDLRGDIGGGVRCVLDENRRRGRAQRHRRVELSKAILESGVAIARCFFYTMPSDETKVRSLSSSHPQRSYAPTGTHSQSRRARSCTFTFASHYQSLTDRQTVLHYGWIPMIIYIGYTRSSPQPMFIKFVPPFSSTTALIL